MEVHSLAKTSSPVQTPQDKKQGANDCKITIIGSLFFIQRYLTALFHSLILTVIRVRNLNSVGIR